VRKIVVGDDGNSTPYDFYHNNRWQVLEVRKHDDTAAWKQYVWDIRYIDAPVIRWWDGDNDGSFEPGDGEVHYYTGGANFNVTGLIDANSGKVVERYLYDPYGRRTVLDGNDDADPNVYEWAPDGDNRSDYDNALGHQGLPHDTESGLIHNRYRYRHPAMGRWLQRDPKRYVDGLSLYEYVRSQPCGTVDPAGTRRLSALPTLWIYPSDEAYCECMYKKYRRRGQCGNVGDVIASAWNASYRAIFDARDNLRGWRIMGNDQQYLFVGTSGAVPHEPTIEHLFDVKRFIETNAATVIRLRNEGESVYAADDFSPLTPQRMEKFRQAFLGLIQEHLRFLQKNSFVIECSDKDDKWCDGVAAEAYVDRADIGAKTIHLCPAFWAESFAQNTVTFTHETSHFRKSGGLGTLDREDVAKARSLVLSDAETYAEWVHTAAEKNRTPARWY